MSHSLVELNDLSDEIVLFILKNMHNVEVLFSLMDVNERFSRIAHDLIFTSHLTLMTNFSNDCVDPLPESILNRFCLEILPDIHDKIKWLDLESSSMERILLCTDYPNLCGLGLYCIDVERAISLFTAETVLTRAVNNQISSLVIDFIRDEEQTSRKDANALLFTQILTMFTNLKYFNFGPSLCSYQRVSFVMLPPTIISSTLLELHVHLDSFSNCFDLLDGRFNQLRIFDVIIDLIYRPNLTNNNNKKKLPSLRCFSLHCDIGISFYDELILPLLYRMLNLEKLNLHLTGYRSNGLIDGNDMKKNILNHMARLNQLTFNIRSYTYSSNQIHCSNEDNQHIFRDFTANEIISYVDYFEESQYNECHIYSYPYSYRWKHYHNITNSFPGGLFKYVREISLFDERSFEHQFFLRIAQSFPSLEELTIINKKPQNDKRLRTRTNDNQNFSIIEYPHLIELNLRRAHSDYLEQFLVDTKMSLPNKLCLFVDYKSLKRVTHNFKRNATRINCTKLAFLYTDEDVRFPKHFGEYFPHVDTDIL